MHIEKKADRKRAENGEWRRGVLLSPSQAAKSDERWCFDRLDSLCSTTTNPHLGPRSALASSRCLPAVSGECAVPRRRPGREDNRERGGSHKKGRTWNAEKEEFFRFLEVLFVQRRREKKSSRVPLFSFSPDGSPSSSSPSRRRGRPAFPLAAPRAAEHLSAATASDAASSVPSAVLRAGLSGE